MTFPRGFYYLDDTGSVCALSNIDLFCMDPENIEAAERFLDAASTKLKSAVVCQRAKEQIHTGVKTLQALKRTKLGNLRKASIRFYSTHGLEHFASSVPLRYKDVSLEKDLVEQQIAAVLRTCPFNICINVCTWISPTILRKLVATGNLDYFIRWCVESEGNLKHLDVPEDAKDKAFSLFGDTAEWPHFYAEWLQYRNLKEKSAHGGQVWSTPRSTGMKYVDDATINISPKKRHREDDEALEDSKAESLKFRKSNSHYESSPVLEQDTPGDPCSQDLARTTEASLDITLPSSISARAPGNQYDINWGEPAYGSPYPSPGNFTDQQPINSYLSVQTMGCVGSTEPQARQTSDLMSWQIPNAVPWPSIDYPSLEETL